MERVGAEGLSLLSDSDKCHLLPQSPRLQTGNHIYLALLGQEICIANITHLENNPQFNVSSLLPAPCLQRSYNMEEEEIMVNHSGEKNLPGKSLPFIKTCSGKLIINT